MVSLETASVFFSSEYLTGFQKRKQQRRLKAQNDIAKKLKQKVRDERNKVNSLKF